MLVVGAVLNGLIAVTVKVLVDNGDRVTDWMENQGQSTLSSSVQLAEEIYSQMVSLLRNR